MNELEVLKNSLNISIWMLGVTLFLSVSTVTFSALNMAFQRSHNRKSVKPFCNIHKFINETGIGISIMNAGLGPMIVQKIVLLNSIGDAVKNGRLFSGLLPQELHYDTLVNNNDSYVLPSMGEMKLLQYTADQAETKNAVELLKESLEGKYLCIVFKDIYDHNNEKRELLKF
ncbi:MAG TPA: hypothetical protein PKG60_07700 [Spirochaetota bacterium]|nr:hypothetical protein [Spirochaetota bacterium]HPS87893.1 hypothetical protein [Spirochaetota bacterium]